MSITALDHVQVACPFGGEDVARAFYGDLLELKEDQLHKNLASTSGIWFRGKGVVIHVGPQGGFTPAKKAHPGFLTTNLTALSQKLKTFGHSVSPGADVGRKRFYTEDPFGNRLEFIEEGDGFLQRPK